MLSRNMGHNEDSIGLKFVGKPVFVPKLLFVRWYFVTLQISNLYYRLVLLLVTIDLLSYTFISDVYSSICLITGLTEFYCLGSFVPTSMVFNLVKNTSLISQIRSLFYKQTISWRRLLQICKIFIYIYFKYKINILFLTM